MRNAPFFLLAFLLLSTGTAAIGQSPSGTQESRQQPAGSGEAVENGQPGPEAVAPDAGLCSRQLCPAIPAPPDGRAIISPFIIYTAQEVYEANVSDPSRPSVSIIATVKNTTNITPETVTLTATVNLGGTVKVEPSQTRLLWPQETEDVTVSVTLPETTTTESIGYLKITGALELSPATTYDTQVRLNIRQWHFVKIQNVTLSSDAPVEREPLQLNALVYNLGNGPSNFRVSVQLDGQPIRTLVNGAEMRENTSTPLGAGKFLIVTTSWQATYGHHSLLIEVEDIGSPGEVNASGAPVRDSKVVNFFVAVNFKDWIPYIALAVGIAVVLAIAGYKYRKRLGPGLSRMRGAFRRKGKEDVVVKPGLPKKKGAAVPGGRPGKPSRMPAYSKTGPGRTTVRKK